MQDIEQAVAHVVKNAPDWIRHDLASKDAAIRERSEETLTAMILAAIGALAAGPQ